MKYRAPVFSGNIKFRKRHYLRHIYAINNSWNEEWVSTKKAVFVGYKSSTLVWAKPCIAAYGLGKKYIDYISWIKHG